MMIVVPGFHGGYDRELGCLLGGIGGDGRGGRGGNREQR